MRPVVITGARGTLGQAFERLCELRGLASRSYTRAQLDINDARAIAAVLDRDEPWLVVNAAGYVRVDDAEQEAERCQRANALGPELVARACAARGVHLLAFSSDLVFDGRKREPYDEHDAPAPLGAYGRSKHDGEQRMLDAHPEALVVRTSAFFGPWDEANFLTHVLRELSAGRTLRAANDTTVSPTFVPDLVNASLDLAIDGEHGIWHVANEGAITWADFARAVAALAGHRADLVVDVPGRELGWRARRPAFSALGSARGALLPALTDALQRFHAAREGQP